MDKLTEEEYKELDDIINQISLLKSKRLEKFGKDWQIKINRKYVNKGSRSINDKSILDKHLRKMDETRALKGYTIGRLCAILGFSRNVYSDMKNGYCSNRINSILLNLDWDSL